MEGELLTIGYYLRTTGYCFPYCFLKIFVEDKALIEGDKVVMGGSPSPHPLGKTLIRKSDTKIKISYLSSIHCTRRLSTSSVSIFNSCKKNNQISERATQKDNQ